MAITTDTGAKKIENSENWRNIFGIHNDSVDAYDALAEQKDEEIGIVVKGNKTAHTGGAAAGQFIILRNSTITGCDDGLYTAAQAIPYDTAIDSTYLTPVSGGGLNALNASLSSRTAIVTGTVASGSGSIVTKSYPTGFNKSNCMVISVMIERGHGDKIADMSNNTQRVDVALYDDYIEITTRDATASEWGTVGRPFTIVLLRIS